MQIIVAGAAGQGSKKAGLLIGKLFNHYGYKIFIHEDYESVIKGGHNFSQISVSKEEGSAISERVDYLLALNKEAIEKHIPKLKKGGVLLYDDQIEGLEESIFPKGVDKESAPLKSFVEKAEGIDLMKNTALVAAFAKMAGLEWEEVKKVLERELPVKTEKNLEVAGLAFEGMEKRGEVEKLSEEPSYLLSGNQAVALGALQAGLENYYAYPMTPSTGVLRFLSGIDGVRTFQPESEIAVINSALGSAYAGKRTMIGTSGGGFALMTEGISFSAQAEIPLLITLSQRMGPATGVPTYTAQADLSFALSSGHGDMVRLIAAPGDTKEAYLLSGKCMNMAWKYQLPAILLLDKELAENTYSTKRDFHIEKEEAVIGEESEDYLRYEGEDISPVCFPGGEATVKVSGYEHDKKGIATENAEEIKEMHEKRLRKYEKLKNEVESLSEAVKVHKEGETTVVFWGSSKGAVLEATKEMDVGVLQILFMQPLPEERIKEALKGKEKIICVETNATGQLANLLSCAGVKVSEKVLKYDGRPFTVEELKRRLEVSK